MKEYLLKSGRVDYRVIVDGYDLFDCRQFVQNKVIDGHHLPREIVIRVTELELENV